MMKNKRSNLYYIQLITTSAVLIALAIIIATFVPKLPVGGATVTLASHVPLAIAMFLSPLSAAAVAIGSAIGFLLSGTPIVVVVRAATHLLWAIPGSYLIRYTMKNKNPVKRYTFYGLEVLAINAVHGILEFLVIWQMTGFKPTDGFTAFFILVLFPNLIVTALHGVVDFIIATPIYLTVKRYIKN